MSHARRPTAERGNRNSNQPAAESIVFFRFATSRNYSENEDNTEIMNIISTFVLLVRLPPARERERDAALGVHYGLHHSPVRPPQRNAPNAEHHSLHSVTAQRFALSLRY